MNRLILIGNGFDLAHGLQTHYEDFIKWYWREWGNQLHLSHKSEEEDRFCSFKLHNTSADWFNALYYLYQIVNPLKPFDALKMVEQIKQNHVLCDFSIKSPFFQKICDEVTLNTKKWVDIEDIYYSFLKSGIAPQQVNDDLEYLKIKLIEYLGSLPNTSINPIIKNQILAPFSKEDIAIGSMDLWKAEIKNRLNYKDDEWERLLVGYNPKGTKQYSVSTIQYYKTKYTIDFLSDNFNSINEKMCPAFYLPDNIMMLNFNYTNTADMYFPRVEKFSVIHIHGSLSNPESIIFGYGDERDDEYEALIKKNDNEYLRHIKSFHYLESFNYRKMLEFIELGPYQVCIMGHSCGISDRTLLCTLFEHPNCVSIKPYYYQKDDGTDNYFDLVCSIARNISDPRLMRDRVVRKERCEALGC